ncbi:hypothetical protein GYA37_00680 [candidate division WWE3 bacterium]|uniref:Uncharacterized protein n=1 Tax=candidate division WWE3 bacterium TaxID=2053526 RepID=A0A7X9E6L5_UNCKA|nr:hypothetical protein [candidate division WWE3 bacterium]
MKDQKNKTQIMYAVITIAIVICVSLLICRKGNSTNPGTGNKQGENAQFKGGDKTPPEGAPQGKGFDPNNIDYALIAQKLNLTEDKVKEVLTVKAGEQLNLENAATTLGVSVADLRTAMGIPEMGSPRSEETNNSSN